MPPPARRKAGTARTGTGPRRRTAAAACRSVEVAAYVAYVFTFHRLLAEPGSRIGWRESYDISLAGVVASRVFATAGAGGIALTVWALDRSGMGRRQLVTRLTASMCCSTRSSGPRWSSPALRCEPACWMVRPRSA